MFLHSLIVGDSAVSPIDFLNRCRRLHSIFVTGPFLITNPDYQLKFDWLLETEPVKA